jgi:hypothetical protein
VTRRTALWALAIVLGTTACADVGSSIRSDGQTTFDRAARKLVVASAELSGPFVDVGSCLDGARFGDEAAAELQRERNLPKGAVTQLADDPLWTDTTSCLEPHQIEVYASVHLPNDLDSAITSYADLLDVTTPLYRAVRDNVVRQCARQIPLIASVAADTRLDLDVLPMIASEKVGRRAWDPVPIDVWEAGERDFVCTYQQPSPSRTMYEAILTGSYPDQGRSCLAGELFVACDERHDTERVALFIVDRSIDHGQLPGEAAVTSAGMVDLGAAEWTMLDDACQRYLNAIAPNAPAGIYGVADTYPELYPNEFGSFNVMCLARSPFGTDPDDMVTASSSVYEG